MILFVEINDSEPFDFLGVLKRAREQDSGSLDALFKLFYPRVERMVHMNLASDLRVNRPWMSSRFSTGDVVQEVFRSVLTDLGSFAGTNEGAFAGYLAMIVRNRILDVIRFHEAARRDGRRGGVPVEDAGLASHECDPQAAAATREELMRFHEALQEFPERERLLIRARFDKSASFEELTERLATRPCPWRGARSTQRRPTSRPGWETATNSRTRPARRPRRRTHLENHRTHHA